MVNQQDTVATQSHLQCPVLNSLPGARFVLQPIANQGADVIQHDQFGIWLQGLLNEPLPIDDRRDSTEDTGTGG